MFSVANRIFWLISVLCAACISFACKAVALPTCTESKQPNAKFIKGSVETQIRCNYTKQTKQICNADTIKKIATEFKYQQDKSLRPETILPADLFLWLRLKNCPAQSSQFDVPITAKLTSLEWITPRKTVTVVFTSQEIRIDRPPLCSVGAVCPACPIGKSCSLPYPKPPQESQISIKNSVPTEAKQTVLRDVSFTGLGALLLLAARTLGMMLQRRRGTSLAAAKDAEFANRDVLVTGRLLPSRDKPEGTLA